MEVGQKSFIAYLLLAVDVGQSNASHGGKTDWLSLHPPTMPRMVVTVVIGLVDIEEILQTVVVEIHQRRTAPEDIDDELRAKSSARRVMELQAGLGGDFSMPGNRQVAPNRLSGFTRLRPDDRHSLP